jgi:hypothetical protein
MKSKIKIFNEILKLKKYNDNLKAISALHIIKIHPVYFGKKYKIGFFIEKFYKLFILRSFGYFLYLINSILKKKNKIFLKKRILIISHLVNNKQVDSKRDFYYGGLEKILKKKNITYLKVFINHTNLDSNNLNLKIKNKNYFVLDRYLKPSLELKIILKKTKTSIDLILLLAKNKITFEVFKDLFISLFDSQTTFALRMHYQIKRYVKQAKPKYCLLTFEGYSWERLCIQAVKKVDNQIKCVGYQHTILSNNHHAIFRSLPNCFMPNVIWSSNISSFNLLKKKSNKKTKIEFIGNLSSINIKKKKTLNKKFFLVIPEGIFSESVDLFKFSLNCANKCKDFNFIWRVHPVINFDNVIKSLKLNASKLPQNIIISKNSLDEDISKCSFVIYKGSAAVIKSVLNGCFPIYFESRNEKNFDPLKEFFKKENYVRNVEDFIFLTNKVNKNLFKIFRKKIIKIKKNYFLKPKVSKIISTIS